LDSRASAQQLSVYRGLKGLGKFWVELAETWDSYVVAVAEYQDLGDWVFTPVDVTAKGRQTGVPVRMRIFEMWQGPEKQDRRHEGLSLGGRGR
jgi:hypothetical protein